MKKHTIPKQVTHLKCEKCNHKVNAYTLGWRPQWVYNCYKCNISVELDGGIGTVAITPNSLDKKVKEVDDYYFAELIKKNIEQSTFIHSVNNKCLNSNWIASFLAKEGEEHCQCDFKCKVKVVIERNGHPPREYVVTGKEFNKLVKDFPLKYKTNILGV